MTKAMVLVIALLAAVAGLQWNAATSARHRADVAEKSLRAERTAREQESAARVAEQKRADQLQEVLDAAHIAQRKAEDDARAAAAAAPGVRQLARQLAAATRCPAEGAKPAAGSPAASAPGDLLADMFERADEEAAELARYADQARVAGIACERAYRALTSEGP